MFYKKTPIITLYILINSQRAFALDADTDKTSSTVRQIDEKKAIADNEEAVKHFEFASQNIENGYYEYAIDDALIVVRKTNDDALRARAFDLIDQAKKKIDTHYSDIRNWSGPRLGAVGILDAKSRQLMYDYGAKFPVVSAFGWQFEYRFISGRPDEKVAGLITFVPMLLGIDQSVPMLSLNAFIGLRFDSEIEFGVGPHVLFAPISPFASVGIGLTIGNNFKTTKLNFPMNVVAVLGKDSVRVGLFFGFNTVNQ